MEKTSTVVKTFSFEEGKGLAVELVNGAKYLYPKATKKVADELASAESKGKYFTQVIKKDFKEFVKL